MGAKPRHRRRHACSALLVIAMTTLGTLVLGSSPASAHAFLVTSNPQPGQRLAGAPSQIVLRFSEPVAVSSPRVSVQTTSGHRTRAGQLQLGDNAQTLTLPVFDLGRGIYEVSWSVTAQDGHDTAGTFAFAIGNVAGALPVTSVTATSVSLPEATATTLFLAGAALALGGLVSELFVWRPRHPRGDAGAPGVPPAPVALGLVTALAGSALQLTVLVADMHGSLGTAAAWRATLGSRAGLGSAIELVSCAYALWVLRVSRFRVLALAPLGLAVVAAALRGHSGTTHTWWAGPANVVHLVLAGLWVGALAHLVRVLRQLEPGARLRAASDSIHRYATLALVAVPPLLVAGAVTVLAQLHHLSDLVTTAYGLILLTKLSVVIAVLGLAAGARARGLGPNGLHLRALRGLTRAELGGLFVIVAASAALTATAPPAPGQLASDLLGAPPLRGPVTRDAALAGQLTVFVSAAEGRLRIDADTPDGQPARLTRLEVEARYPNAPSVGLYPRGCGSGCATMPIDWPPGTTSFRVRVDASGWAGATATLTLEWPPGPDATALLAQVVATMRTQPSIIVTEQVSSGPHSQSPAAPVTLTGADFINQEPYANGGAVDVRSHPRAEGLVDIEWSLPGSQIWGQLTIDDTERLRHELIVDPGHRIDRTFDYTAQ